MRPLEGLGKRPDVGEGNVGAGEVGRAGAQPHLLDSPQVLIRHLAPVLEVAAGSPSAANSSRTWPVPTPSTIRPLATRSAVASILAVTAGCRKGRTSTQVPIWTRWVPAASALTRVSAS